MIIYKYLAMLTKKVIGYLVNCNHCHYYGGLKRQDAKDYFIKQKSAAFSSHTFCIDSRSYMILLL